MQKTLKMIFPLAFFIMLVGCTHNLYTSNTPAPKSSLALAVGDIEVVDQSVALDHSSKWIDPRIGQQLKNYMVVQLRPVGGEHKGFLIIRQANIKEKNVAEKEDNWELKGQSVIYTAEIELSFEIRDLNGMPVQVAHAIARRSRSVPEAISEAERKKLIQHMAKQVIESASEELEKDIKGLMPLMVRGVM